MYSLLGLCLAMLLSTMLVALLVLLRRARGQKEGGQKKGQQPDGHRQTSKGMQPHSFSAHLGSAPGRRMNGEHVPHKQHMRAPE